LKPRASRVAKRSADRAAGTTVLALVLLVVASPRARAQSAPIPDIEHTTLHIRPDLIHRRLHVTAALDIANPRDTTEFSYLLADWYDSVAVRSLSGPATFTRFGGGITVHVTRPERRERLVFTLSGSPGQSVDDDRPVLADSSIYLLWSDRFYPADFDDWTRLTTSIELPRGFRVFAPGRRTSAGGRDSLEAETYETSRPIRAASILADRRWVETVRTIDGRTLRTLLYPAQQHWAGQIFRTSSDVLAFLVEHYGPYEYDDFTFATLSGIYARRSLEDGIVYEPGYLDQEMRTTGRDVHETSLLWWFGTTAGRGPGAWQWTEGFGDYAEVLYDEARGLPLPANFTRFHDGYMRVAGTPDEPGITALRGPQAGNVEHGRLPWVMHVLRFAVGDSAFDRSMRLLFERWRFRTFTLDEFVSTLADGTGQPLEWWRREWLERRGVPQLAWHADVVPEKTVEPDGAATTVYRVVVHVRQTGDLYHLPLEIGMETPGGMKLERVRLERMAQTFELRATSRPRRVLLDPRHWLRLARITPE
jgi:hypothetical protein